MLTAHVLCKFGIILFSIYYSYAEINSTQFLPIIKKCICKANEALTREGCLEKSPLYIQIWNSSRSDVDVKNITDFPVKIEELVCNNDSVLETINGWAFISEDGKLMNYPENNTDQYCIENLINDNGEAAQMSKKCMSKHPVNLCCEPDEYMDSSNRCTKIPNSLVKTFATDWFNKFQYLTNNIDCNGTEKEHYTLPVDIPLSDLKGMLTDYDEITNGKLCMGMYGDENELYPGITYCRSSEFDSTEVHVRIRHCCGENEAYDVEKTDCVPYKGTFEFPSNIQWPTKRASIIPYSTVNCSIVNILTLDNKTMHHFNPNGSLYSESGNMIKYNEYCLGTIIKNNDIRHSGLTCFIEPESERCPWRWKLYRICIGISSFFLVLTLIVYIGISDLRKRISGVCLISELAALLTSQITLIVIQMRTADFSTPGCLTAGVIEIISILASFFWLNIMCYDVWSTFRVFRPFSEKVFNLKLLIKYFLYAWGIPILVGVLAIILEFTDIELLKPGFTPDTKCFFRSTDRVLQWFYIYGIILILLLINLGFFVHLAYTLMTNQMESRKHLKRKGGNPTDKSNIDIENLKLHGKLFVIMGLPWVIEAFTSFATEESECYIWVLDLFNMLRGFFIFVIFVCKKSTKDKLIAEWFPSYKNDQLQSSSSSRKISTTTLSLSNWLPSMPGRKISKVSLTSGGNINLEALKEEVNEAIEEEQTEKSQASKS